jgi:cytochrome oxidase Cu insertion factor (SCO1/SenC/PrrC family)
MDPHCVDICPLVSQEFVDAFHDLGVTSTHVVFLAVNVNQYFASVANVAAYSNEHQLDSIPSWHFFTGTTGALHAVWRDYGVAVEASNPRADIVHTSVIFFIDSRGRERYIAVPEADHTSKGVAFLPAESLISWGRGIALVVKSLSR